MTDHPLTGPASAGAAATGPPETRTDRQHPLRGRVRGLLCLFTAAVAGVYTLQLLIEQPPGDVHPNIAAVFTASLTAWSLLHHRERARWATDPLLVAALLGMALTVPTEGWIWGPCYLVVFQRGLDATSWGTWGWSGFSFLAYQTTVARLDGVAEVFTISTISTTVEFVVATLIIRILVSALDTNEIATRRERLLADGSSRLLSADDEDAVAAIVADITRALGATPTATASVWVAAGEGRFRRAAARGDYLVGRDEIDIELLPDSFAQAVRAGRPFVTEAGVLRDALGDPAVPDQGQTFATAPVLVDDEVVCTIVLQDDGRVSDDLVEAMVRFANEVSAAWQRVVLLRRLRETNDELLAAAQIKDDFIAAVSHELRTPLTSVLGFVDVLLRGWDRLDDAAKREYLGLVRAQAGRQRELIDDLLSMSRIVAGELQAKPSVVDVGASVAAMVAAAGIEAAVTAEPDLPGAWVDRRHLEQIVTNLLTNAGKYGAAPYEVILTGGDEVAVSVVDHGRGVPEEFVAHLFERFSQANTGDGRSSSGVGLGLAISAELAHANGAALAYAPTPDGGATFTLRLPTTAAGTDGGTPASGGADYGAPAVSATAHPA
ncbi:MAG TPA: GAF domain-containing sensor histidine kinase [Egicoccus sp.]|nr:GAF domain-containing sensor histidine kinase [Egicoccus sp.]HSK21986.1 GAF domain-containing sensor histidine kinase [Egicoccus sp.]